MCDYTMLSCAYAPCELAPFQVIESLDTRSHALLESPTGTGKTLCLLCAALAWLNEHKTAMRHTAAVGQNHASLNSHEMDSIGLLTPCTRIVYLSRTHSQLANVVKELKKTVYKPRIAVLASRESTCLHPVVRKQRGVVQNAMCKATCKANGCKCC